MYGLDEYYHGLIEEAKSPEEILKILEYQFVQGKGVPRNIVVDIFNIDPTKKKSYTRWVLMQYDKYSKEINEALSNGKLERMFKTFKDRAAEGLDLTNIENFQKALEYVPDVDPILSKEGDPNAPENNFDIVYNSSEWTIAVPHTFEADRKLGQGCRWCTAGAFGDNDYYWKRYSAAGPLWVNFDKRQSEIAPRDGKEYPYKRYQFLFEWQNYNGELMDSHDSRINFQDIEMPEEVCDFYEEQNPRYREVIDNNGVDEQEIWEEYEQERYDRSITVLTIPGRFDRDLYLMPEENDDRELDTYYYLYDADDPSDPIDTFHSFNSDDFLLYRTPSQTAALLKDDRDRNVLVYVDGRSFNTQDVDDYSIDNGLMFVDDGRLLFVAPINDEFFDDENSYIASMEVDEPYSKIFVNTNISEQVANRGGYKVFFEMVFNNEIHSLYSYNGYEIEKVIKGDRPVNGESYEMSEEDGVLCIQGVRFTHKLDEDFVSDRTNLENIQDIGEVNGKEYCLVANYDDDINLYDLTSKRVVFDKPFASIKVIDYDNSYIVCTIRGGEGRNATACLYSIAEQNFVTPECQGIYDNSDDGIITCNIAENNYWILYGGKKFGRPFTKIAESIAMPSVRYDSSRDRWISFKNERGFNLLNPETGKKLLQDGEEGKNWGMFNKTNLYFSLGNDNFIKIYSCVNGRLLYDGVCYSNGYPRQVGPKYIVLKLASDNKYYLIDENGDKIIPGVDEIKFWSADPDFVTIKDKGMLWISSVASGYEILIPKNGIDLSEYQIDSTTWNGVVLSLNGYRFRLELHRDGSYSVVSNGIENQSIVDKINNDFSINDTNNEVNQISENFKRIYKSIIDTELRRNRHE